MNDILVLIGTILLTSTPIIMSIMYVHWIKIGKIYDKEAEESTQGVDSHE